MRPAPLSKDQQVVARLLDSLMLAWTMRSGRATDDQLAEIVIECQAVLRRYGVTVEEIQA